MNSLKVIKPYRWEGMWVFDDAAVGLVREPFVSGADVMIDRLVSDIPSASEGFRLIFSPTPFPGYSAHLSWRREEDEGTWYFSEDFNLEGWLCPALLHYFESAPSDIYAKAEAISN